MFAKIYRTASIVPALANLRFKRSPKKVVDFAISHPLIAPSQVPSEIYRLAEIIAELRPYRAMEIGTFQGGTLCMLCRLSRPTASIVSVDLPGGKFGGGYTKPRALLYHGFRKYFQKITLIRGNSHSQDTFKRVREINPTLDFLFIDGDHTYEGVKFDFEMYSSLVRPGGVIALHDIAEHPPESGCDVFSFWNEVKTKYRHEEIIADRKQGWAGIGVLYV